MIVSSYMTKPAEKLFYIQHMVTAIDVVHSPDFFYAGEMHDFWEFVYVVDGTITVTADERVLTVSKGQLLIHKPMEFHSFRVSHNSSPHLLIVSFGMDGDTDFFKNKLFTLDKAREEELRLVVEKMRAFFAVETQTNGEREYRLKSHLAEAAIENFLLELLDFEGEKHQPQSKNRKEYKRIVGVMNAHLTQNLSVPDIAELCNLSVSSLKKKFALYSDKGVSKYYTGLRIRKAIDMMCDNHSVSEIADTLNFSSQNYFYAVFKREMGVTPKTYLEQMKTPARST